MRTRRKRLQRCRRRMSLEQYRLHVHGITKQRFVILGWWPIVPYAGYEPQMPTTKMRVTDIDFAKGIVTYSSSRHRSQTHDS